MNAARVPKTWLTKHVTKIVLEILIPDVAQDEAWVGWGRGGGGGDGFITLLEVFVPVIPTAQKPRAARSCRR